MFPDKKLHPAQDFAEKLFALRNEFEGKLTQVGCAELFINEAIDAIGDDPDLDPVRLLLQQAIELTVGNPLASA